MKLKAIMGVVYNRLKGREERELRKELSVVLIVVFLFTILLFVLTLPIIGFSVQPMRGPATSIHVTVDGYKPPFNDYAQSGVPDFDQKQNEWGFPEPWTYCGPTAVANSLWWMDSRFEDPESPPPPTISDSFVMITRYDLAWDDHDPQNVQPLIEDLAWYVDTDGQRTGYTHRGTLVWDMYAGIVQYLLDRGLQRVFEVQVWEKPFFENVTDVVERCEDVILLLGFWQSQEIEPGFWDWVRVGGHYVTVSGVWSEELKIAFSDPYINNAEGGRPGRVLPYLHECNSSLHNNATFVSHDQYAVGLDSPSPGGEWNITNYPIFPTTYNIEGQNFQPGEMWEWNPMLPTHVVVEYMVTVSSIPGTEVLLGDANGDGYVNIWDLEILSDAWLSQIGDADFDPRVDFNFDGYINVWDLGTTSEYWLQEV